MADAKSDAVPAVLEDYFTELGIHCPPDKIHLDLTPEQLIDAAVEQDEGTLTSTGSLAVLTGAYTGRSPKDRFIVDTPDVHDTIAWGAINQPLPVDDFHKLLNNVTAYLSERDLYVVRGLAGADRRHSRKFLVTCELASEALFAHQMLVRPTTSELASYGLPDFTVLAAPEYHCDPERDGTPSDACVAIDFEERIIVIAGTRYAGEIKKSIFSTMNYLLPVEDHILTMHCSANMDPEDGDTAVFFGLSGTGKTTLSADPARQLIGDDEHAWGPDGIFNIEGGCYAKCIDLDPEREPDIFKAIRYGSISENVVIDEETGVADYSDSRYTENTRAAYPIENIDNCLPEGMGKAPSVVIFLTADAFGVLPPISRLDQNSAMYHFMTGFTAKVAGTEVGIVEPVPTFSALFGEPFMPLDPLTYANMLSERITADNTRVYLLNTGWTGGEYGTGHRISIKDTRALVSAALNGSIEDSEFVHDDRFNVDVPTSCPGVESSILDPRSTWASPDEYDKTADKLAHMFEDNFAKRYPDAPDNVRDAGPHAKA